jgi:hypothetical protein
MSEDIERSEVHQAVDQAVEELLAAAGVQEPPVDAIALAREHLGLVVSLDRGRSRQWGRGGKQVSERPEPTVEENQWTVAHAIGEHLKPALLRRLGIDPEQRQPMTGESLPRLFADRLLVPGRWLADQSRASGYDLLALKEKFRTASHEVIAWRLLDLPEPVIITIIDNGSVSRRRSNAWRVNRDLSEPEKRCQRYVHQYSRPHQLREDEWTVQGWPVHGVDWKREVLRSVLDE